MTTKGFELKDNCREKLLIYLSKAISMLPVIKNPQILDVGCGTGVPALALSKWFKNSIITAVDLDTKAITRFKEKIKDTNLSEKFILLNQSFFDIDFKQQKFDLILAEGFLNIVGFKKGFAVLIQLIKSKGYLILHDEVKNHNEKLSFIEENHCKLICCFKLNENIWYENYISCLEDNLTPCHKKNKQKFKSEIEEIELFKKDPSTFKSIYYIIHKR